MEEDMVKMDMFDKIKEVFDDKYVEMDIFGYCMCVV